MVARILTSLILFYQKGISPWTPASCRYTPTCSEYARQAITSHGAASGARLALLRILRCHPWGGRGFDPVPSSQEASTVGPTTPTRAERADESTTRDFASRHIA